MHLQKHLSRRYGGKDYAKWLVVVIPPNVVGKLGWAEGEDLEARRGSPTAPQACPQGE